MQETGYTGQVDNGILKALQDARLERTEEAVEL
jgi:hypothetical protein